MSATWRGWATAGLLVNPAAGTVLADTGPLAGFTAHLRLVAWSSVPCELVFEHRDPAGAVIQSQILPATWPMPPWNVELPSPGEGASVRLVMRTGIGGEAQASIFFHPVRP